MSAGYDDDVVAWADEQAALLRAGQFSLIDIDHIAEEIEDVGKRERHQLSSRFAVLLAHILKWQVQPARRGSSRARTIVTQRRSIVRLLQRMPSLKPALQDADFMADVWGGALVWAMSETGLHHFPDENPWTLERILEDDFLPD